MGKTLAVLGATGNQGGSVVNNVLSDPQLSKEWKIRIVTRNVNSDAAKKFESKGCQVVQGDNSNYGDLVNAFKDAQAVFIMTAFTPGVNEFESGKKAVDAALVNNVKCILFSTLDSANEVSNGEFQIPHMDEKKKLEDYIRSKPVKASYFSIGSFMENFQWYWKPQKVGDNKWGFINCLSKDTALPFVNVKKDFGKYFVKVFKNFDQYQDKVVYVGSDLLSLSEIANIASKKTGKNVVYEPLKPQEFETLMGPEIGKPIRTMFEYLDKYGIWSASNTTKQLSDEGKQGLTDLDTVEQYFDQNPLELE